MDFPCRGNWLCPEPNNFDLTAKGVAFRKYWAKIPVLFAFAIRIGASDGCNR